MGFEGILKSIRTRPKVYRFGLKRQKRETKERDKRKTKERLKRDNE